MDVAVGLFADREHRVEVVLGEDLERDHRVGVEDPGQPARPAATTSASRSGSTTRIDGDEVPLAGYRVGLGHALDLGQAAA